MKLLQRFRMIENGAPVPLNISDKAIRRDWIRIIDSILILIIFSFFTWASYRVFHKPAEMPKKEVIKQVDACRKQGKTSLVRYMDNFEPIYVQCK